MRFFDFFINLFFPIRCVGCGLEAGYLCGKCSKKLVLKKFQKCPVCRRKNSSGEFCSERCKSGFYFDQLIVCSKYKKGELLVKMISVFKYKFSKELGAILGELLLQKFKKLDTPLDLRIIPIPIHKKRFKFRGFNQTVILSEHLSSETGFPIIDCLERNSFLEAQAHLSRAGRIKNLKDAISIKDWGKTAVNGRTVILIDDVATTCSTLNECAKILKKSGAENVLALVLARGQ